MFASVLYGGNVLLLLIWESVKLGFSRKTQKTISFLGLSSLLPLSFFPLFFLLSAEEERKDGNIEEVRLE